MWKVATTPFIHLFSSTLLQKRFPLVVQYRAILAKLDHLEFDNNRLNSSVFGLRNKIVEVEFKNHSLKQQVTEMKT
jgi:hypothetical protein